MSSTPGERALQCLAEMKDKQVVLPVFKTPKTKAVKNQNRMEILDEEKYVEEMGKIIQRDFFPELEKLRAQNQYLEAAERNDTITLRELYAKYTGSKPTDHRESSPATFETPLIGASAAPSIRSHKSSSSTKSSNASSIAKRHSLDSFTAHFTSEDNNSFQEIIEKADRKLKQKFAVLFDAEKSTAIEMAKSLALPSIETQFAAIEGPKNLDMWTYKNKNYVMYVPDGVEYTKEEQLEMAKNRQLVVHSNTRLSQNPWDEQKNKEAISQAAKTQSKALSGKIGVDGNVIQSNATPQIRGFRFERTPSPCPGVAESPLMTWGEIEGTPFRLDGGDTPLRPSIPGPSFRIAEVSRREAIGLQLAEKAGQRMRGQKAKAMEAARRNIAASPYIRSSLDRLASMSPAAKRLASGGGGKGGFMTPNSLLTPGAKSLGSFTPKSARSSRASPSPLLVRKRGEGTPGRIDYGRKKGVEVTADMTCDLLNLPPPGKRNKASDFF